LEDRKRADSIFQELMEKQGLMDGTIPFSSELGLFKSNN
jgi:hypothetical protein